MASARLGPGLKLRNRNKAGLLLRNIGAAKLGALGNQAAAVRCRVPLN
jgi:hypothetical protein